MASCTQFFHSSFRLHPIVKYRVDAPYFHLSAKPSNSFHCNPGNLRPFPLVLSRPRIEAFASSTSNSSAQVLTQTQTTSPQELLSGSTRTLATLLALALSLSGLFIKLVQKIPFPIKALCLIPGPEQLAAILNLRRNDICTMGPLFFASLRDRPANYLNTPLTVVAAGLSKWLDIYSGVLMVRVLLSWFPNIPWERQPLSAIRDLCDPYLNLFRNIIPPVFDTLDVSPLLAFAVLGTLGSILHGKSG